jgi:hypothetical protein
LAKLLPSFVPIADIDFRGQEEEPRTQANETNQSCFALRLTRFADSKMLLKKQG